MTIIKTTEEIFNRSVDNLEWWKRGVFYQIYPRSFLDTMGNGIGDLNGIIEKLDYLNDGTANSLGIDAIWFSPFFVSPDLDFGYDVADYCDIATCYGSLDDFDRLLKEAHKRNIRIMIDLVLNHTSDQHRWFKESRSSRDNPKRDWYIWRDGRGPRNAPPNNWKNNFFGSAWAWDEITGQYYLHSFLKEQPDLNWFNPEVRQAIHKVIRFWLERGVDGFRLDVAHCYCQDEEFRDNPSVFHRIKRFRHSPFWDRPLIVNIFQLLELPELQDKVYSRHHPETHNILKEFRKIFDEYPGTTSVGEINSENPALVASYYGDNNDELHMNFYFSLAQNRWKASAFRRSVERWENNLPSKAWPAYTFSNHDIMRAISRYARKGQEDKRARLLAMMLLTLRGTPFIYYGEEIGMKEAKLPRQALKDPVGIKWFPIYRGRDGARTPMQWTAERHAGFTSAEPWLPAGPEVESRNVAYQEKDPASLLNLYKKLIHLGKRSPALQEGLYSSITSGVAGDCYFYLRESNGERLLVALNFSNGKRKYDTSLLADQSRILLSTDPNRGEEVIQDELVLKPLEGCIVLLKD
ncbi:MAG: alpha-glucosidase [Bacillota bacterium]|nr:alpha-glucosidase [Bacillota bacterium]